MSSLSKRTKITKLMQNHPDYGLLLVHPNPRRLVTSRYSCEFLLFPGQNPTMTGHPVQEVNICCLPCASAVQLATCSPHPSIHLTRWALSLCVHVAGCPSAHVPLPHCCLSGSPTPSPTPTPTRTLPPSVTSVLPHLCCELERHVTH